MKSPLVGTAAVSAVNIVAMYVALNHRCDHTSLIATFNRYLENHLAQSIVESSLVSTAAVGAANVIATYVALKLKYQMQSCSSY